MIVLAFVVMIGLPTIWYPLRYRYRKHVYFAGLASVETLEQYWDRRTTGLRPSEIQRRREILRKQEQANYTSYRLQLDHTTMAVLVRNDTETLKDWWLYDKVQEGGWSVPDTVFSSKVRDGRTQCRIVLKEVDSASPPKIEFSELEWLSGFESLILGARDTLVARSLFPYAVLFGRLTRFSSVGIIAFLVVLQFPAYGLVFLFTKGRRSPIAKAFSILAIHGIGVWLCLILH
jgi:hypothetical protein